MREDTGERVVALLRHRRLRASTRPRPQSLTFPIPDGVDDGTALALLLQGLTAWHLYRTSRAHRRRASRSSCTPRRAASARSPSSSATRWAPAASSRPPRREDKRALALELGADAAVDAAPEGLAERLHRGQRRAQGRRRLRDGRRRGLRRSRCAALAPFGRLVAYGIASRRAQHRSTPGALMRRSQSVVGFWLMHCLGQPEHGRRGAGRPLRARRPRRAARGRRRDLPAGRRRAGAGGPRRAPHHGQGPARPERDEPRPEPRRAARRDRLRRPRPVRADAPRPAGRRLRAAQPDPGAGHPADARRAGTSSARRRPARARPPPSACRCSRHVDPCVQRGPGARPHADARAVHPGHPGASAPTAQRKGVDVVAVFGGAPIRSQQAQLRAGGHVVVGTVGRVLDLISARVADAAHAAASSSSTRPTRCSTSASWRTSSGSSR